MTNEEMQSTVQFILEQQAQFSVNMQRLGENVIKLEGSVAALGEKVDKLAEEQESLRRLVGAIAVAQANTEANLARTEANLNALIVVVERYVSERRNGQS
ncbi:MAG TPA: hypothetical protein VGC91_00945 [Pyrinomonadaceae bacterium]|jgi:hypothetical protein